MTSDESNSPYSSLLPLRAIEIVLEYREPATLSFYHQPALTAFLRHLLGSPEDYDLLITIDAPESGRTQYLAGEQYVFTVFAISGGEKHIERLLQLLPELPRSAPLKDKKLPFGKNVVFIEARDFFTHKVISKIDELSHFDYENLVKDSKEVLSASSITIDFYAPARLLLDKNIRDNLKGEARFVRDGANFNFELFANRVFDSVSDLLARRGLPRPLRRAMPTAVQASSSMIWADCSYRDESSFMKLLGGTIGRASFNELHGLQQELSELLVLGQYLGIGQRRAFGLGRYSLILHACKRELERSLPARTLLEKAFDWAEEDKTVLFVCEPSAVLRTTNQRIVVERDSKEVCSLPFRGVESIVLFGSHNISTPALRQAMLAEVPVHFASSTGHYLGVCLNGGKALGKRGLWLKQETFFSIEQNALIAAKEVVQARLFNSREVLRRRREDSADIAGLNELAQLNERVNGARTLEELNGLEGAGAKIYFREIAALVPKEFCFTGRNRRPPRDPFNALLSFGYTMLYSYVDTVLRSVGMLPYFGFYHQPHGSHACLASDLMEPFRHVIERVALNSVCENILRPEHSLVTKLEPV